MQEAAFPKITWNNAITEVAYKGNNLQLSKLRAGLVKMIEDCTREISKLCKGANIGVKISNNFIEDLSSDASGQAYLDSHFTRD